MILDFDSKTLANMQIALDRACTKIPGATKHRDRRFVADRIIRCARKGNQTFESLLQAGAIAAAELRKRARAKEARSLVSDPEGNKPTGTTSSAA